MAWGDSFGSSWDQAWGETDAPPTPVPGDNPVWGASWGGSWGVSWGTQVPSVPGFSVPWGNSWGLSWGNSWGALAQTPEYALADVLVEAKRIGFFDGYQRPVGATFYIDSPYEFSPYWMRLIDTPPADWLPLMPDFDPHVNRTILRPTTESEAQRWALTGEEPPEEFI